MSTRFVTATEFKAKCLGLMGEIESKGNSITVTRRGRPVAVFGPVRKNRRKTSMGSWAGKAKIAGDIVYHDTSSLFDCLNGKVE
ncbi:MAG TPA: type II toxin-antitoxin system prevent-host-death family antitoxin [Candidatus Acidoferrales bacterium]|nr:type II toxin-antitoxin system prevent-host-death family antitoxin [Candidatus Acidoferrales bacterium]